jgi:galactofuranose transport system substrate-binding protein
MRTPLRPAVALACALVVPLLVSSCSSPRREAGVRFIVGVSQANLTEPWRIAMNEEIKEEAVTYPGLRMIYADAADSSSRQVDDVHRLMGYGIDLLIISPNDSRILTPVVREAYARIPVIVLDRAIEGYDYSLFIGPDNERLGREAGKVASELLGKKGGNILEIEGRSGSPPSLERNSGFAEELDKRPGARLLEPIVADWLRDNAEDALSSRLGALPAIDVVFAQNDAMAYGAWKACAAKGKTGIAFIGIDGLPGPMGGIDLVRKGILSATFTCPTGGKEAVIYAMDLLLKKEGIPKKIYLRPTKVTQEVLAKSLAAPKPRAEAAPQGRPVVLGFAQVGSESEWRIANTKSIKSAAAKAGISLLFEDGKQRQENQIAAIRSFIRRKVDVIAFSPVVESGWDEVLKEAKAAGIPVILSDRTVDLKDDSLWLSFMGSDFVEEGRRAARWLVERKGSQAEVNIVEIRGTIGSAPAIDRSAGFEEVIKDCLGYRIVASESGDFFRSQGYTVMKGILSRYHPRVDAVFAHNDDMAIGAIQALEEAGLKPGKNVTIVSIDAAHGAFKAMIEGKLNCTVECNPLLGPQLMKAVKDYMSGKELPLRMITSEGVFPATTARRDMVGREY